MNMKQIGESLNEKLYPPYVTPQPMDTDEAYDNLYPTSPPMPRPDPDDDSPLYPPWVKDDREQPPLMDK